jgi:Domain of unknown function (DUF4252)
MNRTSKSRGWKSISGVLTLLAVLSLPCMAQNLKLDRLEKLSSKASQVNNVTLEGDMLRTALQFIDKDHDRDAAEVKSMLKDLKGIYVRSFQFKNPNQYTKEDLDAIRSQLSTPAWNKIVESRDDKVGQSNEVYLMMDDGKVAGVAILVAEPLELTVVNIVGRIDMEKLSGLAGNLGIPTLKKRPKNQNSGASEGESH